MDDRTTKWSRSHPQGGLKTKLWLRRARNEPVNMHITLCKQTAAGGSRDYSNTSPLTFIRGAVGGRMALHGCLKDCRSYASYRGRHKTQEGNQANSFFSVDRCLCCYGCCLRTVEARRGVGRSHGVDHPLHLRGPPRVRVRYGPLRQHVLDPAHRSLHLGNALRVWETHTL